MDNYADIERLIGNRICAVCDQRPRIVTVLNDWQNHVITYGMRCECGVDKASLVRPRRLADQRREELEAANAKTESRLDIEGLF